MNLLALTVLNQVHSIRFHQFGQGTIQRSFLAQVSGCDVALHFRRGSLSANYFCNQLIFKFKLMEFLLQATF